MFLLVFVVEFSNSYSLSLERGLVSDVGSFWKKRISQYFALNFFLIHHGRTFACF